MLVGEMQRYYRMHGRPGNKIKRVGIMIRLFIKFVVLKKNPILLQQNRINRQLYPESCGKRQISDNMLWRHINKAGIVIFDLWYVLIYPALSDKQMISLLEAKVEHPGLSVDLKNIFLESKKMQKNLINIYMDFCLDNDYMHVIWNRTQEMGKKTYVYNNTKLSDENVMVILKNFDYDAEIYHGNPSNEVYIAADTAGKAKIRYQNVNKLGKNYRPFYCENVITTIYNQIVNLKLHSGREAKSLFYEYGFTCGGILTCGFCQYLNQLVEQENIDKLIFVSRDGDIIKKVYDQYYKKCDTSYLLFSRFASYEIIFEDFPEEYIEKNIKTRMMSRRKDRTIGRILRECGLQCLEERLKSNGLSYREELCDKNYAQFKQFLMQNKDCIMGEFHDSAIAARKYFEQEIQGYNKICVVDLGWRGTSTVYLKHLFKKVSRWEGQVMGAVIGVALDDVTQIYIRNGMLHAYAFDNEFFRRTGAYNGEYMSQEELFCIEALFSAKEPTLLRYKLDENDEVNFIYGPSNKNREIIAEIQAGIADYAKECAPLLEKYNLTILPRDAYTPLDFCMKNRRYRKMIYRGYIEEKDAINGFV